MREPASSRLSLSCAVAATCGCLDLPQPGSDGRLRAARTAVRAPPSPSKFRKSDDCSTRLPESALRDELPDVEQFSCLAEAQVVLGDWRTDPNDHHPNSSLGMRAPAAFATSLREAPTGLGGNTGGEKPTSVPGGATVSGTPAPAETPATQNSRVLRRSRAAVASPVASPTPSAGHIHYSSPRGWTEPRSRTEQRSPIGTLRPQGGAKWIAHFRKSRGPWCPAGLPAGPAAPGGGVVQRAVWCDPPTRVSRRARGALGSDLRDGARIRRSPLAEAQRPVAHAARTSPSEPRLSVQARYPSVALARAAPLSESPGASDKPPSGGRTVCLAAAVACGPGPGGGGVLAAGLARWQRRSTRCAAFHEGSRASQPPPNAPRVSMPPQRRAAAAAQCPSVRARALTVRTRGGDVGAGSPCGPRRGLRGNGWCGWVRGRREPPSPPGDSASSGSCLIAHHTR